jgi:hypothetical protein
MSIDTPLKNCRAGHIPIRSETRDILLRPIEADFTWTAAFLQLYTSLTYVYALVVQIMLIAGVCSAAFICPRRGPTTSDAKHLSDLLWGTVVP